MGRPGCGGFGIRNFLTLFLSIEVSKAMTASDKCSAEGDAAGAAKADKQVEVFTEQLDLSNPILTVISDAMTAEADAIIAAENAKTEAEKKEAQAAVAKYSEIKLNGNKQLQELSEKYKNIM